MRNRIVAVVATLLALVGIAAAPAAAATEQTAYPVNWTCIADPCSNVHTDTTIQNVVLRLGNPGGEAKSPLLSDFIGNHGGQWLLVTVRWRANQGLGGVTVIPINTNPAGGWVCNTPIVASSEGYQTNSCTVFNRTGQGNVHIWASGYSEAVNVRWVKIEEF